MVEAGGVFSAAMFEAGLVDEVVVYYAPLLCGGPSPGLAGAGLHESLHLEEVGFQQFGNDIRLRAVVRRPGLCPTGNSASLGECENAGCC